MPTLKLSTGARLHYEEAGQGTPLIALHGLAGTARDDLGAVIDALSHEYRVYAPTMRGYGQSEPKPRRFPTDFYHQDADDVLAFMEALDLPQAHLIGYSDGGEVALLAGVRQPQRFRCIAVWSATGLVPAELRDDIANTDNIPGVEDMVAVMRERHRISDPSAVMTEWAQSYAAIIDAGGDLALSQAHRLTMPVLVMIGAADPMAPRHHAERLVAATPHAQLALFSGGHATHLENLTSFLETLRPFLKAHNH